jgi:hypothetical protein
MSARTPAHAPAHTFPARVHAFMRAGDGGVRLGARGLWVSGWGFRRGETSDRFKRPWRGVKPVLATHVPPPRRSSILGRFSSILGPFPHPPSPPESPSSSQKPPPRPDLLKNEAPRPRKYPSPYPFKSRHCIPIQHRPRADPGRYCIVMRESWSCNRHAMTCPGLPCNPVPPSPPSPRGFPGLPRSGRSTLSPPFPHALPMPCPDIAEVPEGFVRAGEALFGVIPGEYVRVIPRRFLMTIL